MSEAEALRARIRNQRKRLAQLEAICATRRRLLDSLEEATTRSVLREIADLGKFAPPLTNTHRMAQLARDELDRQDKKLLA